MFSPLGIGTESEVRREKEVCYKARDETGDLNAGKAEDLQLTYLLSWVE